MAAVTMAAGLCTVGAAYGGNLDSPAPPTDPGSAMYTLEDIYNRLDTGTAGTQSVFAEPGAGPGSTGHTLNQVMSKAPATNANAAGAAEVLTGKTYWGIKSGEWGSQTGTMTNRGAVTLTPGTTQQAIQQGYHNGSGYVEGDADLATGNIRAGVNIFGVAGKTEVVDTTTGTGAAAGDVLASKTAYVNGAEVTGTMATQTLAPTTVVVAAGYYAATNLAQVDTDLATANIKAGATIFGVGGKTEVVDTTTGDAAAGDLLAGKKAWVDGTEINGTVTAGGNVNGGDGALVITLPDGLYTGSKTATANDSDLASGNIRSGVNVFGVAGDSNVVNTSSGDATAGDILATKKAWVDGAEVTGTAAPAAVPKTGQTSVYRTGDDGTYQKGVALPSSRFTDNGDGTVTDNLTKLMWTKNASIWGTETWNTAVDNCEGYSLAGHSDWRLPNLRELQSLIDYSRYSPALPSGHPFTGVQSSYYWSSTTGARNTAYAWSVYLDDGLVYDSLLKSSSRYVWPVRGGQ
jgi:hypothetical protein